MGLNLTERSSGIYQGKLKISKRGHPRPRKWLYFAALRLVKQAGVAPWYQAKKGRDGQQAKRALVGLMRKLVPALYRIAVTGAAFEAGEIFFAGGGGAKDTGRGGEGAGHGGGGAGARAGHAGGRVGSKGGLPESRGWI